jgi:multicomponent Na+:H+ antiporter subunit B
MSDRLRRNCLLISGVGLAWLLCRAVLRLPPWGNFMGAYGLYFNAVTVASRHITNVPTAINFDFRGVDTMGEEYILFGSVIGTLTLLRQMPGEAEEAREEEISGRDVERSEAVRLLGLIMTGLLILFGIYIILHAHLTPGGGFQGGAIVGTAALLMYLASDYEIYERLSPASLMEFGHASGAGSYVAIGMAGLIVGRPFLQNFLPFGTTGHFASGGLIPLLNGAVGLEVSIGFAIIFREFVTQTHRHKR